MLVSVMWVSWCFPVLHSVYAALGYCSKVELLHGKIRFFSVTSTVSATVFLLFVLHALNPDMLCTQAYCLGT
jgi:hypothetical protein